MTNKVKIFIGGLLAIIVSLSIMACGNDNSNDAQNDYSEKQGQQAQKKWGNPNVTNFTEYKFAIEVAAKRDDPNLVNFAYLQALDGSLRCYGKVVGYGIPYSTQITPPYRTSTYGSVPVREPNALFMPESAAATWIMVIDPATGKTEVDYVEPNLVVSRIERPCKPLDK